MLQKPSVHSIMAVILSLGLSVHVTRAQDNDDDSHSIASLKKLSLEELMNIDVTILGKNSQRLFESAAAVSVISGDEIRRSGARSIPEALRLSPMLNVAQVDSRQWAVSSRGFNTTSANKLLVLIDDRSVYTTLFSGVFWDVQDVLMEDIERIEVISGPGGTLWGTNAVNGIINIITRSSHTTQAEPFYFSAGAGTQENVSGAVRYGGELGEEWSYRAYLKYFDRDQTEIESTGLGANDAWNGLQGGFRTDCDFSPDDAITVQGDLYHTEADQFMRDMATMQGGNILAKWEHSFADNSSMMLRSYFDYTHRRMPDVFGEDRRVFDVELEHYVGLGIHQVSWGLGVRTGTSSVINSMALAFLPEKMGGTRFSGFIQDDLSLADDLNLTLGTKVTKGLNANWEFQPRISIGWSATNQAFLWAAVTRAVRTPSRIDLDLYVPGVPPYTIAGGHEFVSEKLIAFETGYRCQMIEDLLLDLTLFCNLYDDVRSVEPGPPSTVQNGLEATTYGGELVLSTELATWWGIKAGYSHLQKMISLKPWSMDLNGGMGEGNDHKHRVVVQSSMEVLSLEIDLFYRFVDKLPNPTAFVPSYSTLDCRLGWNLTENIEVSVLVQNIFLENHVEFGSPASREQIGREVFAGLSVSL